MEKVEKKETIEIVVDGRAQCNINRLELRLYVF